MSTRTYLANELLADALVEAAHKSECVAELIQLRPSEDGALWCLSCSDSDVCWEWRAMDALSWQEILDARRRFKMNRRRKWARNGRRQADLIQVVERSDRTAA
jgi:hypothetical protein